jgi:hypothetical protein
MVGEMEGILSRQKASAIFTAFRAVNNVAIRRMNVAGARAVTGFVHVNVQSRTSEQPESHSRFPPE